MKRILPLLTLLLALLLCACAQEPSSPVPAPTFTPEPTATPVPTPSPTPTVTPMPTDPNHKSRVPVLMYHQVASPEENDLYLSPENFQSQLDWLAENGYTPVTMAQLARHWRLNEALPDKPIVLTFDDGYLPMYTEVYPRLLEKGWAATFYIVPLYTGDAATFVTPDMVEEMARGGMDIGSHTYNHLQLNELDVDGQLYELELSKATLEAWTHQEVVSFCYPSGRYTDDAIRSVMDTGYTSAVTTEYAMADESNGYFTIPRIRISWGMDGGDLGRALQNLE